MPLWTSEYLKRLTLEAEIAIAGEVPCIIDRISIATEVNLGEYLLPDYVNNVRRVFWKGKRLSPTEHLRIPEWPIAYSQEQEGAFELLGFDSETFDTSSYTVAHGSNGEPAEYWYSTYGENVIRFFPIPNESVPSYPEDIVSGAFEVSAFSDAFYTDETGLWGSQIEQSVVIEFYRVPDGVTWKIPEYVRRRTIKAYVMWKAFAKEGKGQNLKASQYWQNKYVILIARMNKIINNIHQAEVRTRNQIISNECITVPRPQLPWNWQVVPAEEDDY